MAAKHLPPALTQAYLSLSTDPQGKRRTELARELEGISKLIALAKDHGLSVPELDGITSARAGITVGADKFCPCCLRPFAAKAP
jgi:hypothetical protein